MNLLDDSLVDVVLDSAASGWNTVEREGISILHPAKFIMIGSGNQEEGEMRPQLLDRFGCAVTVNTIMDAEQRTDLVMNRIDFERDPEAFAAAAAAETEELRQKLSNARKIVRQVTMARDLTIKISEARRGAARDAHGRHERGDARQRCSDGGPRLPSRPQVCSLVNIDGLRGDIVINRASKALAAFEGRTEARGAAPHPAARSFLSALGCSVLPRLGLTGRHPVLPASRRRRTTSSASSPCA